MIIKLPSVTSVTAKHGKGTKRGVLRHTPVSDFQNQLAPDINSHWNPIWTLSLLYFHPSWIQNSGCIYNFYASTSFYEYVENEVKLVAWVITARDHLCKTRLHLLRVQYWTYVWPINITALCHILKTPTRVDHYDCWGGTSALESSTMLLISQKAMRFLFIQNNRGHSYKSLIDSNNCLTDWTRHLYRTEWRVDHFG